MDLGAAPHPHHPQAQLSYSSPWAGKRCPLLVQVDRRGQGQPPALHEMPAVGGRIPSACRQKVHPTIAQPGCCSVRAVCSREALSTVWVQGRLNRASLRSWPKMSERQNGEAGRLPPQLEREGGHFLGALCPVLEPLICAQELGRSTQLSGPGLCFEKLCETGRLVPACFRSSPLQNRMSICEEWRETKWVRASL